MNKEIMEDIIMVFAIILTGVGTIIVIRIAITLLFGV